MKTRRENVFKLIMGRAISTLEYTPRVNGTCTNMSKDVYVYTQTQKAVVIGYDTHSVYMALFTIKRTHKKWLSHDNICL